MLVPRRDARGRIGNATTIDERDLSHKEITRIFREMSAYATKQLDNIQRGFYEYSGPNGELKEVPVKPELVQRAAEFITERAWGKAVQPIITDEPPRPIDVGELTDEQLEAALIVAEITPKKLEEVDWHGGE